MYTPVARCKKRMLNSPSRRDRSSGKMEIKVAGREGTRDLLKLSCKTMSVMGS